MDKVIAGAFKFFGGEKMGIRAARARQHNPSTHLITPDIGLLSQGDKELKYKMPETVPVLDCIWVYFLTVSVNSKTNCETENIIIMIIIGDLPDVLRTLFFPAANFQKSPRCFC